MHRSSLSRMRDLYYASDLLVGAKGASNQLPISVSYIFIGRSFMIYIYTKGIDQVVQCVKHRQISFSRDMGVTGNDTAGVYVCVGGGGKQ